MAAQERINKPQRRKRFSWIRLFILIIGLLFFAAGTTFWLLSNAHIIDSSWFNILSIVFGVLGVALTFIFWLFPFPSNQLEVAPLKNPGASSNSQDLSVQKAHQAQQIQNVQSLQQFFFSPGFPEPQQLPPAVRAITLDNVSATQSADPKNERQNVIATLASMPPIAIDRADLIRFGQAWISNGERLSRTPPQSSAELGRLFDNAVGKALAVMLGGIPIVSPNSNLLAAPQSDCVEVGYVRVIGGVRPQAFDVGYRPDGVRFVFDSKTLNDRESIGKNWQNMINDLAIEATTVHSRFPHAVVAFIVIYPEPCVSSATRIATIETLERLARRSSVSDPFHLAEVISLVLWHPSSGTIDTAIPAPSSTLRIEKFSEQVEAAYVGRYKGLPPHIT